MCLSVDSCFCLNTCICVRKRDQVVFTETQEVTDVRRESTHSAFPKEGDKRLQLES